MTVGVTLSSVGRVRGAEYAALLQVRVDEGGGGCGFGGWWWKVKVEGRWHVPIRADTDCRSAGAHGCDAMRMKVGGARTRPQGLM